ncbi:DUF6702 family protein [Flavobacterium aciduliphilum]|uniref:Peptidase E n=1 Tax=Flavobacterium aciduliphilum TaxID=1101402 RepID=A0A328YHJ0_9FLAO|nr:DUF6702 family protein [Flavobacterium aciduliphilum]RAR71452.1 hypothetical protein CLV55_1077 [Flavobacterium aciduliphilum]
MIKHKKIFWVLIFWFVFIAMMPHKFYSSIFQINYVPQKKMVQITSRIFVDDLNQALEKKYHRKFFIGTEKESLQEEQELLKYLSETVVLKINGKVRSLDFRSKEVEANVLICYFRITEVTKIHTFEIENTTLMELYPEQQNIVQANIFGEKKSFLLTADNFKGMLKK